jgi:hypothetical protein
MGWNRQLTVPCFSWLGRGGEGANQQRVGQRVWQIVNGLKGKSLGKQDLRCKDPKIDLETSSGRFLFVDHLKSFPKICCHTPASLGWIFLSTTVTSWGMDIPGRLQNWRHTEGFSAQCPAGRAFHVFECFRRFTTGSQSLMVYLSVFCLKLV